MKLMLSVVCLAVVLAQVSASALRPPPPTKNCTYFCQRGSSLTYECCDDGPKQCPPVRDICPPTVADFRPPNVCRSDGACRPTEKCCHDTCLGHRTCKPAVTRG